MATNRLVEKQVVATYAAALLDGVRDAGGAQEALAVREELVSVVKAVRTDARIGELLNDGSRTGEQRGEIARELFGSCQGFVRDVLGVMAQRGEIDLLPRVLDDFEAGLREKMNLTIVEVTTAIPLDDDLRRQIEDKLSADLGTDVALSERVDKAILGGIIMSANGRRIDASVTSQLDHARNVLKQTTDGGERS